MRFVASPSSHTIKKAMLRLSALWALKLANNCGSCVLLALSTAIARDRGNVL